VNMDLQNLFSTQSTSKQTPSQPQTSQSTTIDPKKINEAVEGLFNNIRWFVNWNLNYEETN
jgi:hypothetical protein